MCAGNFGLQVCWKEEACGMLRVQENKEFWLCVNGEIFKYYIKEQRTGLAFSDMSLQWWHAHGKLSFCSPGFTHISSSFRNINKHITLENYNLIPVLTAKSVSQSRLSQSSERYYFLRFPLNGKGQLWCSTITSTEGKSQGQVEFEPCRGVESLPWLRPGYSCCPFTQSHWKYPRAEMARARKRIKKSVCPIPKSQS